MLLIQVLYTSAALIALIAGIPQMIKLVRTKNSDEFNLGTWAMWVGTQSITTLYALSIGDLLFIVVSGSWVAFYAAMVTLIIRYAPRRTLMTDTAGAIRAGPSPVPVSIESQD